MPEGPKYIVIVTWFNYTSKSWAKQIGTIIHEEIVLTWGDPFIKTVKRGSCILAHDLHAYAPEHVRKWNRLKYYDEEINIYKKTQSFALIKLEEKIILDGVHFKALDINFDFKPESNINTIAATFSLSADNKVVYSASVYTRTGSDTCYQFGDCIQTYFWDKTSCLRFFITSPGSPVVHAGELIGTVRRSLSECNYNFPTDINFAMNEVYNYKKLIQLWTEELLVAPPKIYSEFSKYMSFYGYQRDGNTFFHAAAILGDSVLITHYPEWLTDDVTDPFVVYRTPDITDDAAENMKKIKFKQIVPFSKPPFKSSDIQLTLIKLSNGMKLDGGRYAKLSLSKTKYPFRGSRCVVAITSTQVAKRPSSSRDTKLKRAKPERIVEHIEVSLWTYNECKDYVKGINASQFCIRIHDSVDQGDHCKYIPAGSPVICNSRLTGIVNLMTPCKPSQPRPCTNIYPFKEWIYANMREPEMEAEMQEVSTEKKPKVAPKKATATKYVLSIIVIVLALVCYEGQMKCSSLEVELKNDMGVDFLAER
ncbi:hypothetical protein GQX74_012101 [Glossina fuscipes]|nr:hypothetical protein GQX74_012101 [Glossina fuscipes]